MGEASILSSILAKLLLLDTNCENIFVLSLVAAETIFFKSLHVISNPNVRLQLGMWWKSFWMKLHSIVNDFCRNFLKTKYWGTCSMFIDSNTSILSSAAIERLFSVGKDVPISLSAMA